MTMPPRPTRITSGFGVRIGRTGAPTFHAGLDFYGRTGDPVVAVADGTVVKVATDDARSGGTQGYGNVVALDHGDGWWSVYAHLSRIDVGEGEAVTEAQQVGLVGNTSNGKFRGMGAHLHFEIRNASAGTPFPGPYRRWNVDPRTWLEERGVMYDARARLVSEGD